MTQEQLEELIEKRKKERAKDNGEEYVEQSEVVIDRSSPDYLKSKIDKLEAKLSKYEENGMAKLYYSLNRKANEMAELMNDISLRDIDIDDPKSKTFDRLKVIWQGASEIATSLTQLGQMSGVLKTDKKTEEAKPFVDTIAIDRR
jgi:hypothetical protein